MKIVLIIYALSWLILLALYLSHKLRKNRTPEPKESWKFYLLLILFSPLFVLAIPYILISDSIKWKKVKRRIEENERKYTEMEQRRKEEMDSRNKARDQMYTITFRDLPFEPEEGQVIYVENHFDEKVNSFSINPLNL